MMKIITGCSLDMNCLLNVSVLLKIAINSGTKIFFQHILFDLTLPL